MVGVGEEGVITPDGEQGIGVAGVFDAAHDESGGDRCGGGGECGVGDFGDLGIRDPVAGVGIMHGARIGHRGPGIARGSWRSQRATVRFLVRTSEKRASWRGSRPRLPHGYHRLNHRARRSGRLTPAARAVPMA